MTRKKIQLLKVCCLSSFVLMHTSYELHEPFRRELMLSTSYFVELIYGSFSWYKALGTKRLASEEFINDWDNKRLNAGEMSNYSLVWSFSRNYGSLISYGVLEVLLIPFSKNSRQVVPSIHTRGMGKWLVPLLIKHLECMLRIQAGALQQHQIFKCMCSHRNWLQCLLFLEKGNDFFVFSNFWFYLNWLLKKK